MSSGTEPATGAQNPIVTALHQMALTVLSQHLREMFDRADDILFDSAQKANAPDEQRLYMATMRTVRLQRDRIIQVFQQSLEAALTRVGDELDKPNSAHLNDMSQWALEDGDLVEERMALANMESKASAVNAHDLGELKRRLAALSGQAGGSLSEDTMSPSRIIHSFQDSMKDLPVDFPIKLVIYKLFDRVVVNRLPEVFTDANQLLAVNGIEPIDEVAPVQRRRSDVRAPTRPDAGSAVPSWASQFDPATMGAFGVSTGPRATAQGAPPAAQHGNPYAAPGAGWGAGAAGPQGNAYTDSVLASEVANILNGYRQGKRPTAPAWLPPETVALVARMFDDYYRDPRLPDALRPALGKLQLPVMKAALNDSTFFSNPAHPARRVLNDLFEMFVQFGTAQDAPQAPPLGDLHGLIDVLAESLDLDLTKLQESAPEAVDEDTAQAFLREQEAHQHQKNRQRVERVRRVVAHELRRRIGDRPVAAGVMRLMLSGFGPLLSIDYIRGGLDGAAWAESMRLVDRVLDSLRPHSANDVGRTEEEATIVAAISHRLARIGFTEARSADVIAGLLQAYLENADQATVPETGADTVTPDQLPPSQPMRRSISTDRDLQGLLSILLVPNTWYTLVDASSNAKLWVRVKNYYPAQNVVLFSHYMEPRYISLRAAAFATALIDGHAAPIDPSPELRTATEQLCLLEFARAADPLIWTGADGKPVSEP